MKTLYISDLDGTLLNSNAEISEFTQKALNKLIDDGLNFSIATARSAATAVRMVEKINLNLPVILMNGVSLFDTKKGEYVITQFIEKASVIRLFDTLKDNNLTGFLFTIEDNEQNTYYEYLYSEHAKRFIREREEKFKKRFTKVKNFYDLKERPVAYFSVCDKKEKLINAYKELCFDKNLNIEFYRDIYEQDFWYMEVCSAKASKYNAVNFMRENYNFDKVVSFGDNMNDLSMFLASDECYAVENAKEEVKSKATGIIESNNSNGVAKWLLKRMDI